MYDDYDDDYDQYQIDQAAYEHLQRHTDHAAFDLLGMWKADLEAATSFQAAIDAADPATGLTYATAQRQRNAAARRQCLKDIGGAFLFMALLAGTVAASGWLVKHYLL